MKDNNDVCIIISTCMPHTAGRWFATMLATTAFLLSQQLSPSFESMADVRTLKDITLRLRYSWWGGKTVFKALCCWKCTWTGCGRLQGR